MAAVENLKIIVDAEIGKAVASLIDLQDELRDVAESIRDVRATGQNGIDVNTKVESITDDLIALQHQIALFERANDINIGTDISGGGGMSRGAMGAAFGGTTGRGNTPRGTSTGFATLLRGLTDSRGGGLFSKADTWRL